MATGFVAGQSEVIPDHATLRTWSQAWMQTWLHANAPTRRHPPDQPLGLLKDDDDEIAAAAKEMSAAAPALFGRLDEVWLRGTFILMHPREKQHLHEHEVLDELIEEALRSAALQIETARDAGTPPCKMDFSAIEQQVSNAEQFLARREGEIARHRYSRGLMLGVLYSVFLLMGLYAAAIGAIALWTHSGAVPADQLDAIRDVLVAVGGGAAGACVSVLLRLHHIDTLTIEAARGGAARYRIYLGWFFAAALVALLKSGMLGDVIIVPSTSSNSVTTWFFWGALGFLAGFNERWATNLISRGPGEKADGTGKAAKAAATAPSKR